MPIVRIHPRFTLSGQTCLFGSWKRNEVQKVKSEWLDEATHDTCKDFSGITELEE